MRIKKILVIDDDRDMAALVRDFLTDKGYCVLVAHDGKEGLDLCRSEKPDLVTLDLLMPKINGIQFLEILRSDPHLSSIPVVVVSVVAEKGGKDGEIFRLGVIDWLNKPFEFDEFLRIIKESENIGKEERSGIKKIVIVDEDQNVAESIANVLESRGYTPVIFNTAENVVEKIAAEKPFLILIDIILSGIEGVEIIRMLKRNSATSNIPAVVLSGHDVNDLKKQCLLAGATEYYAGSFTSETFLSELQSNIIKYEMTKIQRHARILVADDDMDLANLAMDNLRVEGFETVYACNGEEAVKLTYKEMPDLILLDINMPKKDGYQVFKEVKADILLNNIPVIMITAKSSTREKVLGLELGADDYITKPYDLEELVARVKMILRRTTSNRELNPLTRLPGNVAIEESIIDCIKKDAPFAVLYLDLNNFKAYNDYYGFSRGDEVIKATARITLEALKEHDCKDDFIGHIGGDDFIILTAPEKAEALCKRITAKYDEAAPGWYDDEDRARGFISTRDRQDKAMNFPFVSIAIGVATTRCGKFSSLGEVSKIGSEMKAFAKKQKEKGSHYSIDERRL